MADSPYEKAQVAYAILKRAIDERFPHGWFVAITNGEVVADAESVEGLTAALAAIGLGFEDVVVTQAGIEPELRYLGYITMSALLGHWIKCVLSAGT